MSGEEFFVKERNHQTNALMEQLAETTFAFQQFVNSTTMASSHVQCTFNGAADDLRDFRKKLSELGRQLEMCVQADAHLKCYQNFARKAEKH